VLYLLRPLMESDQIGKSAADIDRYPQAHCPGRWNSATCGSEGRARRAFLSKYDLITSRTIGAERLPCSPPSSRATTTISGFSRGANPTNQPLSLKSCVSLPDFASATETRCALPVFPDTSI